jgi:two-component system sensor histidine kinase QseC
MEKLHYALYSNLGWYVPALQTQVWKHGKLVYQSPDAGLPPTNSSASPEAQPLRDGWVAWVERDPQSDTTVRMATEVIGEWLLQISSIGYYLEPLLFSLPLLLIPAFFIIRVGLRPLNAIVGEIEGRSAADLTPLAPSPYKELSPLVSSVNRLMERLSERLQREQEFLLDAAHELKTPLSIIQINAESLNNSRSQQRFEEAANGLREGVNRATHTVHQLLALARSGSDRDSTELHDMDLVELIIDRLALAVQIANVRGIELELQGPDSCVLPLHRESMASLIDNLVSNAIKYSPSGSRILVNVNEQHDVENVRTGAQLSIADQGPGIPSDMRKKVFERFFRLPGQDQPGSGLGLAIAERAVARNNGVIRLENANDNTGLVVFVDFPLL